MNINDNHKSLKRLEWLQKSKIRLFGSIFILVIVAILIFLVAGFYTASNKVTSYLPADIPDEIYSQPTGNDNIQITTPWYKLMVDNKGIIAVKTLNDETIISGITYYSEYTGAENSWGLKDVVVRLSNDSTIEITGNCSTRVDVTIFVETHKNLPKTDFRIRAKYTSATVVQREALVASFDVPVTEVYRKNRTVDTDHFEPEYWLDKEGARFGSNVRSALVYHNPGLSSLQLQTKKKLLFLNLEYFLDHPHCFSPSSKRTKEILKDKSRASYRAGNERTNSFSINIGQFPKITPRLMAAPSGYLASYVFTEHADGGNIKTQRAVYFGSELIENAANAVGGFVKYKIPVTKSVFYTATSNDKQGAAIKENNNDSLLIKFLDQLYLTGIYDICLHTPEEANSDRTTLEEAIRFMKERYNAVSWIDHGFYKGEINREAFVAEGLDSNSTFFAADLWQKYGTHYFWGPQVEYIRDSTHLSLSKQIRKFQFFKAYVSLWQNFISPRELKEMNFHDATKELIRRYHNQFETNSLMPGKGDSYPTPLYWQHPTIPDHFYSWATDFVQLYSTLSPEVVKQELVQIDNLIKNRGVFISHGYYVRTTDSEIITTDKKGKLQVNPYYNVILNSIAQKREKGELYTTTIRDLLDYWIKLENVSFEYLPNGEIVIVNNNNQPIKGFSLALKTDRFQVNGKISSTKKLGDDTILWFDIEAGEKVIIKFLD